MDKLKRVKESFCQDMNKSEDLDSLQPLNAYFPPAMHPGKFTELLKNAPNWESGFNRSLRISIPYEEHTDIFQVYIRDPIGRSSSEITTIFLHHGAGHTALSFTLLVSTLVNSSIDPLRIVAYDARGHGKTDCFTAKDLSLKRLSLDLENVILHLCFNDPIVLVGHSMGACVVTHLVSNSTTSPATLAKLKILGLVIIDVVEGNAMPQLSQMNSFLDKIPTRFESVDQAVAWSIQSKTLRNVDSAVISIPSQIQFVLESKNDEENVIETAHYKWITHLKSTSSFWEDWFKNLSTKFINSKTSKLLIISENQQLDTPLLKADMQGKFSLKVIRNTGHCIMEDQPVETAKILLSFLNGTKPLDVNKLREAKQ